MNLKKLKRDVIKTTINIEREPWEKLKVIARGHGISVGRILTAMIEELIAEEESR